MAQRNKLDYHDMNFDQALSLAILICEYYIDQDLPKDKDLTNMGKYEFSVTLRNAILEFRQQLNSVSTRERDRVNVIYRKSAIKLTC